MKYCLHCDWQTQPGIARFDQSKSAVEHFVETGHAIETVEAVSVDGSTSARGAGTDESDGLTFG
ncbi:hypothetical protein [Natronorubrum daqingense]|uniref:Uncharacterized protein n=1 Tax=Natronorubrum daqingense TaxID=588898 RepID=A0A1N7FHS6_9EURY|nr:hypothetical protein [Natronorubrum daqingense]APX98459.1 hypothetical protein BB347_17295 [Natronorubrum daqingense]SIR99902.1 hypothetical protein SAMN05421809_3246 [Natronorubrum daqingense]